MLSSFGFNEYEIELSVRGKGEKEKYIGRDEVWDHAENALKIALDKKDLNTRGWRERRNFTVQLLISRSRTL